MKTIMIIGGCTIVIKKMKQEQSIHNSIQIWYKGDQGSKLVLDVNVWRIKHFLRKTYIDFGLKISEADKVKEVFIYFPFDVGENDIIDLGCKFSEAKMLTGIFNENYVAKIDNKNIDVSDNKTEKIVFSIYQIDTHKDIKFERNYGGIIVSFDVKPNHGYDRYFRFRISLKKYGTFIEHYQPKNSFFESAFTETELLDFRVNERRNQELSLIETTTENARFEIEDINFFVMSPIQDEVTADGINLVYKRQLEAGNFWKEYLGCSYNRMSVYKCNNFNKSGKIESFSCFGKINYRRSNFITIFKYLIVLCIITLTYNIISNYIYDLICDFIFNIN